MAVCNRAMGRTAAMGKNRRRWFENTLQCGAAGSIRKMLDST
jgi:hypothetical protein